MQVVYLSKPWGVHFKDFLRPHSLAIVLCQRICKNGYILVRLESVNAYVIIITMV